LQRLYQLQQQNQDLAALQQQEQQAAETAIFKLLLLSGVPSLGGLAGVGILLTWAGAQILRFFRQRQSASDGVLVCGFFGLKFYL
jgi:uncharacterized protein